MESVSVIIPVKNKWELTESCLQSLHEHLPKYACEVIVIDNSSEDETKDACPALGKKLFGPDFLYYRSEHNLNFGPASNLGAKLSRHPFLLFLNNDTYVCPGWFESLLRDFSDYTGLGATGPVLLYPGESPLGDTVQHLGVYIHPLLSVGHLYEGIPVNSCLAKKRRFFQVITAACLLIPKFLFLDHGGFHEGYINGYEDVDLCARLWNKGYRMTVNPASHVYHLTSQTSGRYEHEEANSRLLRRSSLNYLTPDLHIHFHNDGLRSTLTEWQTICPEMAVKPRPRLDTLVASENVEVFRDVILQYPLWYEAYAALAQLLLKEEDVNGAVSVLKSLTQLRPLPDVLFSLIEISEKLHDREMFLFAISKIYQFYHKFEKYLQTAQGLRVWYDGIGLDDIAAQCVAWQNNAESFRLQKLAPFFKKFHEITNVKNISIPPL